MKMSAFPLPVTGYPNLATTQVSFSGYYLNLDLSLDRHKTQCVGKAAGIVTTVELVITHQRPLGGMAVRSLSTLY